jgi:threonine/homoserine/homoserine lactone efflux protein
MDAAQVKLVSLITAMVAAAITPGPNNLIVLAVSGRGGIRSAVRPIAGVAIGSIALLLTVWASAAQLISLLPGFRLIVGLLGGAYLAWLGLMLILRSGELDVTPRMLPTGSISMALFQILNPKTWMFISAVTAAGLANPDDLIGLPLLLAVAPAVMIGCLLVWASAGSLLSAWQESPLQSADGPAAAGVGAAPHRVGRAPLK